MITYMNLNGNSNVSCYEIGEDYILVAFHGSRNIYKYSYFATGVLQVEEMKRLAIRGYGLNSYINRNVRKRYETIL